MDICLCYDCGRKFWYYELAQYSGDEKVCPHCGGNNWTVLGSV